MGRPGVLSYAHLLFPVSTPTSRQNPKDGFAGVTRLEGHSLFLFSIGLFWVNLHFVFHFGFFNDLLGTGDWAWLLQLPGSGPHSSSLGRVAADNWLWRQQHLLALSGWCLLWTFSYFGVLKTTHVLWLQTERLLGATFWIFLRVSIPWLNLVYRSLTLRQTLGGQSLGTCISPGDCSLTVENTADVHTQ